MLDLINAMAELEESFAEWRWQMLAAGITAPEPLEELELHLREDVQEQLRIVADAHRAFEVAAKRMGPPSEIKREFNKARGWGIRLWWVCLGIGSFGLVQTAMMNFVGPLVFHRHSSVFFSPKWWADWGPSYIAWIALTVVGAAIGLAKWRSQRRALSQ